MTLPFEMGIGAAAFMAVAVLGSAFVRGYSGFGFSALVISAAFVIGIGLFPDTLLTMARAAGLR